MTPDSRRDKNNSTKAAKAISAMPIAEIVVAVILLMLSGLSIIGSHPSVSTAGHAPRGRNIR